MEGGQLASSLFPVGDGIADAIAVQGGVAVLRGRCRHAEAAELVLPGLQERKQHDGREGSESQRRSLDSLAARRARLVFAGRHRSHLRRVWRPSGQARRVVSSEKVPSQTSTSTP